MAATAAAPSPMEKAVAFPSETAAMYGSVPVLKEMMAQQCRGRGFELASGDHTAAVGWPAVEAPPAFKADVGCPCAPALAAAPPTSAPPPPPPPSVSAPPLLPSILHLLPPQRAIRKFRLRMSDIKGCITPAQQSKKFADIALEHYNKNKKIKYELVEATRSNYVRGIESGYVHVNFTAKRNKDGSPEQAFFAELPSSDSCNTSFQQTLSLNKHTKYSETDAWLHH